MGIKTTDGMDLPEDAVTKAWTVAPDGLAGPAFLVYDNYRVIMKWNKSTYFATSVGLLADQIAR
jgi:membrane-bound lytic murein transglycosylase B